MEADVRFAGMGLLEKSTDAFNAAEETTFTVNYEEDDTEVQITYALNGDALERTVDGTSGILAENIERLRFEYLYLSNPGPSEAWVWTNNRQLS